jgi:hypothetical protein
MTAGPGPDRPLVDPDTPSAARLYDYYLGGSYNFAADREMAAQVERVMPSIKDGARANRRFLWRAVRYCAEQGIDQFVDLGCGLPTVGPTHEIAREINPGTAVSYVDNDPIAVAYSQDILAGVPGTEIVDADLRDPERTMRTIARGRLLDLRRPAAALLVSVLHFVADDQDAGEICASYLDHLAPGSYLVLSHPSADLSDDYARGANLYRNTPTPVTLRTRQQIGELFRRTEVVEPGIVPLSAWRPDETENLLAATHSFFAGVGRTRAAPPAGGA